MRDSPRKGGSMTTLELSAWDQFVAESPYGSYLQMAAWAEAKALNGWTATRLVGGELGRDVGAQVLLRRPRPLPWTYAYAPRGPVARHWDPAAMEAFTAGIRDALHERPERISHLRIDPEIEAGGPDDPDGALRATLIAAGWRPAPTVQPSSTWVVDLGPSEDGLWSAMRTTWRGNVNRGRKAGLRVTTSGREGMDEFLAIHRETSLRAGFAIRSDATYRAIWEAFDAVGAAKLLFARAPDGDALATLFLLRCGGRVVEPWAGMTNRGAAARANYLLKWEAIRSSREAGATVYDMWGGLSFPGVAAFKMGFGGREVRYIGAWDLVLDRVGWLVYAPGRRAALRAWTVAGRALARRGADESTSRRRPPSDLENDA